VNNKGKVILSPSSTQIKDKQRVIALHTHRPYGLEIVQCDFHRKNEGSKRTTAMSPTNGHWLSATIQQITGRIQKRDVERFKYYCTIPKTGGEISIGSPTYNSWVFPSLVTMRHKRSPSLDLIYRTVTGLGIPQFQTQPVKDTLISPPWPTSFSVETSVPSS